MYPKVTIIVLVIVIFTGCKNDNYSVENQIKNTVVHIPKDSLTRLSPYSHVSYRRDEENWDYQVVIYKDSMSCSICELKQLTVWNRIIEQAKERDKKIDYVFIFCPKECVREDFVYEYYNRRFNMVIYVDTTKIIEKENPIFKNSIFHSLILDRQGHIIKIGDASMSKEAEQKFFKLIE